MNPFAGQKHRSLASRVSTFRHNHFLVATEQRQAKDSTSVCLPHSSNRGCFRIKLFWVGVPANYEQLRRTRARRRRRR